MTVSLYVQASSTVYRDDAGDEPITTRYVNTWYSGTVQPSSTTTVLPIVTTDQNGPGGTDGTDNWTTEEVFSASGNDIWDKDANGVLTYNSYDPVTGLLTATIADVGGTDPRPSGSDLPDPPITLPSSGKNAETDESYDPLGREVQSLGPEFTDADGDSVRTATFTAYLDTLQTLPDGEGFAGPTVGGDATGLGTIVATASGYQDLTADDFVLVNPISLEVSNLDGQDTDDLQAQAGTDLTVTETSSGAALAALATAAASPDSYSRWTHYDYAMAADSSTGYAFGDLMDMRVYNNIEARTFDLTTYGYSANGDLNRTVDPTGTITRTVEDARGLTLSTWVGTADAGATDSLPNDGLTSPTSGNNMLEVSSNQYDGNSDGGDGNLTESKAYVDDNPDDARETLYGYDWRDRPLWAMVNDGTVGTPGRYTFTFNTYDNLDEVTDVTRYWDKLGTTPPDTRPDSERYGLRHLLRDHRPQRRGLRQPGAAVSDDRL